MRKLSTMEFKKACDDEKFSRFIFSLDNQDVKRECCVDIDLVFNRISILFNPNRISLVDGESRIYFNNVEHVVSEGKSALGTIYTIVCNDFLHTGELHNRFRIVAS